MRGAVGQTGGELHHFFIQFVRRDHAIHQPQLVSFYRINRLGQHDQLGRLAHADDARQKEGAAAIGRQADLAVGGVELGALGGDGKVAGQRHAQARASHRAVYLRDHRERQIADIDNARVQRVAQGLDGGGQGGIIFSRMEHGDVTAGEEGLAGALDDQCAQRG